MKERLGEETLGLGSGLVGWLMHQKSAYSQGSPSVSPGSSYPGRLPPKTRAQSARASV